jgi:Animal haem peroxidase
MLKNCCRKAILLLALVGLLGLFILKRKNKNPNQSRSRQSLGWRLFNAAFTKLNQRIAWHKLPPFLGIFNLLAFRNLLRERNLHDTSDLMSRPSPGKCPPEDLVTRRSDGKYNDLDYPEMGAAGERFGRNVPIEHTFPESEPGLLEPSPREVSRRLLARETFIPARTLNLLAAAWIQFQTHDWFSHGEVQRDKPFKIKLRPDDPLVAASGSDSMEIPRTAPDPHPDSGGTLPPTYVNTVSHWWDASAIYGSRKETTDSLRRANATDKDPLPDGKLFLENECLPLDPGTRRVRTGHLDNWWLGLALLHTLFAREHNAVCERLREEYPNWSGDQIFDKARLIISALTAKIHTVEWTPGILAHPTLQIAMNANWWGVATEKITRLFGRLSSSEAISGIPGSPVDHHGAPFTLTEEFVTVYRLHPLIPDDLEIRSLSTGAVLKERPLTMLEIAFENAQSVVDDPDDQTIPPEKKVTIEDVFYSFGISHPGAITLHNFPEFLRNLTIPAHPAQDGSIVPERKLDVAATDIMRDRERGVPRYNKFRQLLGKEPLRSFDELTSNRIWAEEIRDLYGGDIDRVDTQVGMFAEDLPEGFGFSDTAFRVFILMASRRLKSDRFFTTDWTTRTYTQVGMDWINSNDMSSVLLRHYPDLAPTLRGVKNAFAPWNRVT